MRTHLKHWMMAPVLLAAVVLGTGCPSGTPTDDSYDAGFEAGFALDEWYWDGYYDGYDTIDFTPIYYDASEILYLDSPPYDAGYWDGIWYAYNDGYFVDYHYAFILGFSEGYDNAYWPDYLDFLAFDQHTEYENGGWADGYNDGYSEGRVFGANDYEQGLSFDWLDALLDYESGTDLYFVEVDVGTGVYGPVTLYEYGVDPNTLKKNAAVLERGLRTPMTIRGNSRAKAIDVDSLNMYRTLTTSAQNDLKVTPDQSLRDSIELRLTTSWLQRVNAYLSAAKSTKTTGAPRVRAVAAE
ncbi:MAG: hypothetical protein IT364_22885 [Candidatus Hydrogenedentes bacterium]|nr:hypothetical protein [Candidatus Hydrogenedentota bacterium]